MEIWEVKGGDKEIFGDPYTKKEVEDRVFFEVAKKLNWENIGEWESHRDRGAEGRLATTKEDRRRILTIACSTCTELGKDRGIENYIWAEVGGKGGDNVVGEKAVGVEGERELTNSFLGEESLNRGRGDHVRFKNGTKKTANETSGTVLANEPTRGEVGLK